MVVFPNAKINLGLNILFKRPDGFHSLESVFYPVPWSDILEIIPSKTGHFSFSGIKIEGDFMENLCVKVYTALKDKYDLPAIQLHLHKHIPVGAGLGGGSSDAAFTLKLLNQIFKLGMSLEEQINFIRPFGSDCAFFIKNLPALAVEKGDCFEASPVSLLGKYIVLVYPDIFISTKEAYAGIQPKIPAKNIRDVMGDKIDSWSKSLVNDFEPNLIKKYPVIQNIKNQLYACGASYASLSGSGSTMFGIFESVPDLKNSFPKYYSISIGKLNL